ncbi:MAG: transcription-repair coupling factor, partial [Clostridia bacterium]|nr:transcription-repair coupling factor [Clostridia bacterium]
MNSLLKVVPNFKKFNDYIFDIKKGTTPIMLSGLTDVGKVHMAYATKFYTEKPICIITYNEMQAKRIIKDLDYFGETIRFFPKRDVISFDYIAESKDVLYERIAVLNDIEKGKNKIIVTTIEATMQKMISKESLYKHKMHLKVGDQLDLEMLKEKLVLLGFDRYDIIEGRGQFSVRGGIVDIATSRKSGVRIEFWGDEIDSIRKFSIASQRTTEMLKEIDIYPSYEFVLETDINKICENIENKVYNKSLREKAQEDIEQIKNGEFISKIDKYFNDFYEKTETVLDYLNNDYIIFIDEIEKIKARAESITKDNEALIKDFIDRNKIAPGILTEMKDYNNFSEKLQNKQSIYLEKQDIGFVDKQSMHAKRNGYSFSYREVNFFRSSMDLLFQELQEATKGGKETVILGGSTENCKKISSLLFERNIVNTYKEILEDEELAPGSITITPGALSAGFEIKELNLLVVSTEEMFETKRKKTKSSITFKDGEKVVFADLKEGDYIVHRIHGIGQYIGVNTIKADGITKDYIKIKYKDEDILYVPTNALDNIRKYVGPEKIGPKLNRLGSKDWEKTKAKVKNNLRQVAEELIELYAKRQKMQGYAFSKDTSWQQEFENSFPYVETDDQLRCIEEVKKDMENVRPMDRLLCGDVGYGKTEVAIRAAFKAVMDQKQVVYLVPTTILATQQYESFADRMKEYPIKVEVLNRFKTKKEQTEILKKLELGEIDVLVGTHRVLSKDVKFKNLGFLIIDEEHRFGVKDKEKIKELKNNIDVLTMTATPIPRTLHMSVVGMRDMSVIYEPPQDRIPVQTYVLEYDKEVIKEAITRELERDGQIFYLFNNVEGIIKKADEINKLVPEAKVDFAHGKMNGAELENIMQDFIDKKTNVLVCTTILESGIDIPNANTIIV